jgi:hypothetical protein
MQGFVKGILCFLSGVSNIAFKVIEGRNLLGVVPTIGKFRQRANLRTWPKFKE